MSFGVMVIYVIWVEMYWEVFDFVKFGCMSGEVICGYRFCIRRFCVNVSCNVYVFFIVGLWIVVELVKVGEVYRFCYLLDMFVCVSDFCYE